MGVWHRICFNIPRAYSGVVGDAYKMGGYIMRLKLPFLIIFVLLIAVPASGSHMTTYLTNGDKEETSDYKVPESRTEFATTDAIKNETPKFAFVVNIPATELLVFEDGDLVKRYKVAVGSVIHKTPLFTAAIKRIEWNPWWYPPKSEWAKKDKITPPGPKNPLGPVKFIVTGADIRMHGTNAERSIGSAASHGCLRMYNKDAKELAWYIQERLSDKTDPMLLAKYEKMRGTTFGVPLKEEIPLYIVYERADLDGSELVFFPDLYGRGGSLTPLVTSILIQNGLDPMAFDLSRLSTVDRRAAKIERVNLNQLLNRLPPSTRTDDLTSPSM